MTAIAERLVVGVLTGAGIEAGVIVAVGTGNGVAVGTGEGVAVGSAAVGADMEDTVGDDLGSAAGAEIGTDSLQANPVRANRVRSPAARDLLIDRSS